MDQQEISVKACTTESIGAHEVKKAQSKEVEAMEEDTPELADIVNLSEKSTDIPEEHSDSSIKTTEEHANPAADVEIAVVQTVRDDAAQNLGNICHKIESSKGNVAEISSIALHTNENDTVEDNLKTSEENLQTEQYSVVTSSFVIDPAPENERSTTDTEGSSDSDSDVSNTPQKSNAAHPQPAIQKPLEQTGLGAIASQYDSVSESEDDDSSDSIEIVSTEISALDHRNSKVIISSDSESDVEVVSHTIAPSRVIEVEDDEDENNGKPRGPVRAKGEMLLEDLPPIEDLHITVPEEECIELGKIHSIVEQLVLVDCIPGTAALDLDTVLFLEKGNKVLGEVFDVIGQVASPLYCVRFNSNKQIKEKGIEIGQTVYVAPRTEHTHFIILSNLMSIRGSDASWEDDVEPPEKHLQYSDDEEERNARRSGKNRRQQEEEGDVVKKHRSAPQVQQHQHTRDVRQRYQRPQQYQTPPPSYSPNQMSPTPAFQYNTTNTAWHSNYSCPPSLYPNPYARFTSPSNSRPQYTPPGYSPPQFNSPNNNRTRHMTPNRESPQIPQSNTQFVSPNNFSQPQFISPGQSNMSFIPPNQSNPQFGPPNSSNPHFTTPPNFMYQSLFPPPPPPRQ